MLPCLLVCQIQDCLGEVYFTLIYLNSRFGDIILSSVGKLKLVLSLRQLSLSVMGWNSITECIQFFLTSEPFPNICLLCSLMLKVTIDLLVLFFHSWPTIFMNSLCICLSSSVLIVFVDVSGRYLHRTFHVLILMLFLFPFVVY